MEVVDVEEVAVVAVLAAGSRRLLGELEPFFVAQRLPRHQVHLPPLPPPLHARRELRPQQPRARLLQHALPPLPLTPRLVPRAPPTNDALVLRNEIVGIAHARGRQH